MNWWETLALRLMSWISRYPKILTRISFGNGKHSNSVFKTDLIGTVTAALILCSNKDLRTKLLEMKPATANKPTVPELAQLVVSVLKGLEFYLVQWFSGKVVLCCDATIISDGILSLSVCIFCERGN